MDLKRELDLYLRSRHTLIMLAGYEEERVVEQMIELCREGKRNLLQWDHADGFQILTGELPPPPPARDPLTALETIEKGSDDNLFLLRDFHQCWANQPRVIRKLRNLAQRLKYTRSSLIITTPDRSCPEELKDDMLVLDVPPPDFKGLVAILNSLLETPGIKVDLTRDEGERLVRAALGLSSTQARRAFSKAIVQDGALTRDDIQLIQEEKSLIVRQSGALEFFAAQESMADVGGLEALKGWLGQRQRAFGSEARDYGLPTPKGIALIGIPGTGKSLTAKVVAGMWRMPLIRLDVGALYGGLVGQSEENARRALRLVETVAPCLLWIDELEKGLSQGDGDGGTSSRVFGTLLSWMQEKQKPVFVIATANDIGRLPPELLRRGRFDEIFFLDLPNRHERREIFAVHIRKRDRDPEGFDLDALAAAAEGYVGAEIEQVVIDAMYRAFNDPEQPAREFTDADLMAALRQLVPMSRSQRDRISGLRAWITEGRAQSASLAEERPPPKAAAASVLSHDDLRSWLGDEIQRNDEGGAP